MLKHHITQEEKEEKTVNLHRLESNCIFMKLGSGSELLTDDTLSLNIEKVLFTKFPTVVLQSQHPTHTGDFLPLTHTLNLLINSKVE